MAKNRNNLNVFKGPESIREYFDPEIAPPLPLVEIPDSLNPFRRDGVRIYAKMMTMHPANNVKAMPAKNLLDNSIEPGKTKTIVEYSSGSTVLSMKLIASGCHDVHDVRAFLSNKTSLAKIRIMQLFGINVKLFGGPSQPEPLDERGGIRAAERMAMESSSIVNPNQYDNANNWKSHVLWTGPQILEQLPEINVLCAGMGTSGTMTGLGTFFKEKKPSVFRLGVCTAPGDRVPGPRSRALLEPVEQFPWREAVDRIEEVGSFESFELSAKLTQSGLVCGPSSGFNLKGLYNLIEARKAAGTLSELAGPDGEIHCVFLCCDLPYQYVNEYFDKLGEDYFPPIQNKELLGVDTYRYDEKWERDALEALADFFGMKEDAILSLLCLISKPQSSIPFEVRSQLLKVIHPMPDTAIVDLRQASDFAQFSLPESHNLPFVFPHTVSPFDDPKVLGDLWQRLEGTFKSPSQDVQTRIDGKRILLICYDGDSARMAASVLRAKGYEADSVRGGFTALGGLGVGSSATPSEVDTPQEAMDIELVRETASLA
ncbi:hypothetical protein HIM_06492 [Hirsutella minnesotensis 3608]|uniref:Rhodanese domain-containing protein n=1 Tax=Hirsutella minnesotensis 3608 TaxID=1043627 RepID=A0A0F7ZU09_9HYPO|nr:hypothetical protein HIM_06492 [Hirsutella minnesotensis 3608]